MTNINLDEIHSKVLEKVRELGDFAMKSKKSLNIQVKTDHNNVQSLVTEVDVKVGTELDSFLSNLIEGSTVLSEEKESFEPSEYLWIIDPIDGTRNFTNGLEMWCILITLVHKSVPIYSLIYLPDPVERFIYILKDEVFDKDANQLFYKETEKHKSIVSIEAPNHKLKLKVLKYCLENQMSDRCLHSTGCTSFFLITGSIDLIVLDTLNIWDIAPLLHVSKALRMPMNLSEAKPFEIKDLKTQYSLVVGKKNLVEKVEEKFKITSL